MRIWQTVHLPLGADVHEATAFLAHGMPVNALAAIGLPSGCREREGVKPWELLRLPETGVGPESASVTGLA